MNATLSTPAAPRGEQRARAFDDGAAPGERADGGAGPIAKGGAPLLDLRGIRTGYGRIEALREAMPASPRWAVTRREGVLLLRYLGHERNEAWALCQQAWRILRPLMTGREAQVPRIWLT